MLAESCSEIPSVAYWALAAWRFALFVNTPVQEEF